MKINFLTFTICSLFFFSCSTKVVKVNAIPVKYDGYLHLNIQVENKINANFIFDTGNPMLIMDSLFCKKNGFDFKTKEILIGGIGNETKKVQLITDTIHYKFNNKNKNHYSTSSLLLNLKSMIGEKIDGIAGIQTFAQKLYMIDYISQNIIFIDSVKGFDRINAKFEDNKIYLYLNIKLKNENIIQGKFLLDTGSDQTTLNSHVFKKEGFDNLLGKKKFYHKGGIGGNSDGYFLPVEEINIGKFQIKKIIASVSTDTLGMLANTEYMGIIGNDILDDFHIIFDHPNEKIWVKPNKNFNKNKRKLFRSISFHDDGEKWFVVGIVEETEAYRLGVRMNDEILEVNNIPVEQIELDKFIDKLKENDVLNLKIKRDGEEREIKFKLNVFLKA